MPKTNKLLNNANEIVMLLQEIGSARHSAIATELGIPRANVYRLVDGLIAIGLLRTDDSTGLVRLSNRWIRLAQATKHSFTEWQRIIDTLPCIAQTTKQTAFLSVPTRDGAACIAWSQASSLTVLSLKPGRRLPHNVGAAGRLLFAFTSDPDTRYLSFDALTDRTIGSMKELLEDAQLTRQLGWILSDQDVNVGISAVGVPVYSDYSNSLGCLSISGLSQDINPRAEELAEAISRLSARHEAPSTATSPDQGQRGCLHEAHP